MLEFHSCAVVSLFSDSGVGLVISMVCSSPYKFIIVRLIMWVLLMNGRIVYVHVYKRLLTNCLHGKAAEWGVAYCEAYCDNSVIQLQSPSSTFTVK